MFGVDAGIIVFLFNGFQVILTRELTPKCLLESNDTDVELKMYFGMLFGWNSGAPTLENRALA